MLPTIEHPTEKTNFSQVHLEHYSLAFSYRTIIGYNKWDGRGWIVRENSWGPTTGKHMNALNDDKKARVPADTFESLLESLDTGYDTATR